jgi:hypothetical protein
LGQLIDGELIDGELIDIQAVRFAAQKRTLPETHDRIY